MHGVHKRVTRDWYLAEWMAERGLTQAALARACGWNPAKPSLILKGEQSWSRNDLFAAADALAVEPYELLLTPPDAIAIRAMRDAIKNLRPEI